MCDNFKTLKSKMIKCLYLKMITGRNRKYGVKRVYPSFFRWDDDGRKVLLLTYT